MKVGSLVLCVGNQSQQTPQQLKDNEILKRYGVRFPRINDTYVVRGMVCTTDGAGLFLEEIVNPIVPFIDGTRGEVSFCAKAFRELQPPMDISELIEECQTQTFSI